MSTIRIHCLQHAEFEEPANIAEWARLREFPVSSTLLHRGQSLPPAGTFDMLVLMGGPMSVNDEADFPWLIPEKALVREAIVHGKIVLGVCLGAQLIANAMGSSVYRANEKEIGWFPVRRVREHGLGASFPKEFTPLHWHGETFDLPPEAMRLVETDAVPNQAFQLGDRVLGIQFHIEVNRSSVEGFVTHAAGDIGVGRFQQAPADILACDRQVAELQPVLSGVLDRLISAA